MEFHPYALLEFPTSAFRLAKALYEDRHLDPTTCVFASLALLDVRHWRLREGSPRDPFRDHRTVKGASERDVNVALRLQGTEILSEPDRCGFRLVSEVYQDFGFYEEQIPPEFDRESGRLVIPD